MTIFQTFQFRISRLLAVLLILCGLGSNADAADKLAQIPTEASDQEAQAFISKVLLTSEAFKNTKIRVSGGIAYIEGATPGQKDLEWIKNLVQRLPDVIAVVDYTIGRPRIADLTPTGPQIRSLMDRLQKFLPAILISIFLLIFSYFLSGIVNRRVYSLWSRRIVNPFLLTVVSRLTLISIWLALFYFVVRMLGLTTLGTTLVGGTGILGIIIGLSFKGIAENYLAGLLLAARSPFTRGDLIIIGQYKGYVQNLNMRGTTIIDFSGNLILIPNLMVIQSVVENQTANPKTRTSFTVGIGYQDSIPQAQALIVSAVSTVDGVIDDPAPSVIVQDLGVTRIELSVRVWFDVKKDREKRIRSRAMIMTKETLLANGFSIPNETRELIFNSPIRIENVQPSVGENSPAEARKAQAQKQAASNLTDPDFMHKSTDPSSEELLQQAEKNPLPLNSDEKDLLKR